MRTLLRATKLVARPAAIFPTGAERLSALSFVCASLAHVFVTLFCGLYESEYDPLGNPAGLVWSLVMQVLAALVVRGEPDLAFFKSRDVRKAVGNQDVVELCRTLRHLRWQLPLKTPVYCLINNIMWYEQDKQSADLEIVVNKLHGLVRNIFNRDSSGRGTSS